MGLLLYLARVSQDLGLWYLLHHALEGKLLLTDTEFLACLVSDLSQVLGWRGGYLDSLC